MYKAQLGRLIILNIQQTPAPQQSAVGGSFMTNFEIPKKFTKRTMEALEKGQITKAIHLISATHPTPEEYTGVCIKLITTYPILKDTIGNGYVS